MFMKLLQKVPGFIVEMGKSVKNIVDKLIEFFTNKFDLIKISEKISLIISGMVYLKVGAS